MPKLRQGAGGTSTFVQEVTCDARVIATILRYFDGLGFRFKGYSDLLRLALTEFAHLLSEDGLTKVTLVKTTEEALEVFEAAHLGFPTKGKRNRSAIAQALAAELQSSGQELTPAELAAYMQDQARYATHRPPLQSSDEEYEASLGLIRPSLQRSEANANANANENESGERSEPRHSSDVESDVNDVDNDVDVSEANVSDNEEERN